MIIILVCHSPLGSAMKKSVEHSYKKPIDDLKIVDVTPDQTLESIIKSIEKVWVKSGSPKEIIALSDMIGASPSNGLHNWLSTGKVKYKGFVGINIPSLLCAINHRFESFDILNKKMINTIEISSLQID